MPQCYIQCVPNTRLCVHSSTPHNWKITHAFNASKPGQRAPLCVHFSTPHNWIHTQVINATKQFSMPLFVFIPARPATEITHKSSTQPSSSACPSLCSFQHAPQLNTHTRLLHNQAVKHAPLCVHSSTPRNWTHKSHQRNQAVQQALTQATTPCTYAPGSWPWLSNSECPYICPPPPLFHTQNTNTWIMAATKQSRMPTCRPACPPPHHTHAHTRTHTHAHARTHTHAYARTHTHNTHLGHGCN